MTSDWFSELDEIHMKYGQGKTDYMSYSMKIANFLDKWQHLKEKNHD